MAGGFLELLTTVGMLYVFCGSVQLLWKQTKSVKVPNVSGCGRGAVYSSNL